MNFFQRLLLLITIVSPAGLLAQNDSIRLICPLNEAVVVPPPKNAIRYDPPDLCIVLTSRPDTIVKACITARVTNIETDEDGKLGVVLFTKFKGNDYYFWYTGMNRINVRRNDMVKVGQPIGFITPGDKIEMLMFNFETPLDPTKYLECQSILK